MGKWIPLVFVSPWLVRVLLFNLFYCLKQTATVGCVCVCVYISFVYIGSDPQTYCKKKKKKSFLGQRRLVIRASKHLG